MTHEVGDAVRSVRVVHASGPARTARDDVVAHEEPLEIQVNGSALAVLMRTPGHDEDLVRGFLLTERIIRAMDDIETLRHCTTVPHPEAEENVMQVRLRAHVPFDLERLRRHSFASSSCGVCGKATLENACAVSAPVASTLVVPAAWVSTLPSALRDAQPGFAQSGGLHAAGLFAGGAGLLCAREDVGRHNAVDKVIGHVIDHVTSKNIEVTHSVLFVSGRVSFELVQKAVAARIPILAGVSAPTSLAVRMADALGVTLLGFVRDGGMNIYTHAERVAP